MRRIEIAGVTLGGVLITAGVAVVYWPAALIVAGLLLILAFADLPKAGA